MTLVKRIKNVQRLDSQSPVVIEGVTIREVNRLPCRRADTVFFENTTPAPCLADPEIFTVNWA